MSMSMPMRRTLLVLIAVFALIAAVILVSQPNGNGPELAAGANHAQVSATDSANGPVAQGNGVLMGGAIKHDKSADLRSTPPQPVTALEEDDQGQDGRSNGRSAPHAVDTVVQSQLANPAMPGTSKNFDGIPYPGVACNCAPPDTNGEVGLTQYVQIVNEGYQVFDKSTGASVLGPVGISTIWSAFGGVCQLNGDGDPVVLFDQIANRWLVSQFAGSSVPTDECIAISTTSDATGSYYRYDFHLGSNFFDYPHLSVWPDAYYMSMNVFNSAGTSFLGAEPFAFDRTRMLQGLSATFQTRAPLGSNSDAMLPADLDGSTLPPAGAPATFVAYPSGFAYTTFHYHVDWVNTANTTWTTYAAPAAAGFTALCPTTRACVPQSGVTSSSNLDGLADRPMFRLTYRNFGDHESVVGNFTVSSGGVAGIRWFELRGVNSTETVYQESTYQPDSTWRWMGSAAMDKMGDIALGFSASSSSINPQIRIAGRLATDPLGTLGQGETTVFAGTGSQTSTGNRWGDYSDMTIDPVDDCTFWFTTEYYSTTTSFNWRTRIASFQMPGCSGVLPSPTPAPTAPPTPTPAPTTLPTPTTAPTPTPTPAPGAISGVVTNGETGAGLVGATVQTSTGGYSTTSGAGGAYTLSGVAPGTYTVTASVTGYVSKSNTGVIVTSGNSTPSSFPLTPNPATTSFVFGSSAVPVTSAAGDNNGYETGGANLFAFDGLVATDANSGTGKSLTCTATTRDKEVISGFSLGSLGPSILGIQVQVRGRASSTSNTPRFCVQVSWDGGTTWTSGKSTANLTTSLATYTLGSTSDTWGHTGWTAAQAGAIRVRVIDLANSTARSFYLDGVTVAITYQ